MEVVHVVVGPGTRVLLEELPVPLPHPEASKLARRACRTGR